MSELVIIDNNSQPSLLSACFLKHSKNWRKGNIITMSDVVVQRVIRYAMENPPVNDRHGYYIGMCKFAGSFDGLPCYHCDKCIPLGMTCYSKHRGRNTRSYYHLNCALLLGLIETEELVKMGVVLE